MAHEIPRSGDVVEVVYVLDDHLGFTDALVRHGNDTWLVEAVDWDPRTTHPRLFRVGHIDESVVAGFLHDVSRDYCDLNRKVAQVSALGEQAQWARSVVAIDVRTGNVLARFEPGNVVRHRSRETFDGSILAAADLHIASA